MSNGGTQTDVVGAGDRAVTQPADRALGYGDEAVAQTKKPAKPPAKKPPPPTFFDLVKEALRTLAKDDSKLAYVEVLPWEELKNSVVKKGPWSAWTNSDSVIYLRKTPLGRPANAAVAFVIMYHESRHILDFRDNGIPQSYFLGFKSEYKAQDETFSYLSRRLSEKPTAQERAEFLKETDNAVADALDDMKFLLKKYGDEPDPDKREKTLVQNWVKSGYLPKDVWDDAKGKIKILAPDLYRPN